MKCDGSMVIIGVIALVAFFVPVLFIIIPLALVIGCPLAAIYDRVRPLLPSFSPATWEKIFSMTIAAAVLSPLLALIVWLAHFHLTFSG